MRSKKIIAVLLFLFVNCSYCCPAQKAIPKTSTPTTSKPKPKNKGMSNPICAREVLCSLRIYLESYFSEAKSVAFPLIQLHLCPSGFKFTNNFFQMLI